MSDPDSGQTDNTRSNLVRLGLAHFLQMMVTFSIMGSILFLTAGRLDWWEAWVFLVIYFLIAFMVALWLLRYDPKLLKERDQAILKTDVKDWDRVVIALNLLLTLALFAVIGLDAGRWRWSVVPPVVRVLGGFGVLLSFGVTIWASSVNTYLSAMVRIQRERGHQAITVGPYRYVRHPMYVAMCLLDLGLPLTLGSWWGLVVSGLMMIAVVIRTILEDKTLQRELPGYDEYARQVRHRLIPGVW